MKPDASARAWYIHFIFFFCPPVSKVTTASDNFAPCEQFRHHSGANPRRTFIGKNEFVPLFYAEPASSALPSTAVNSNFQSSVTHLFIILCLLTISLKDTKPNCLHFCISHMANILCLDTKLVHRLCVCLFEDVLLYR